MTLIHELADEETRSAVIEAFAEMGMLPTDDADEYGAPSWAERWDAVAPSGGGWLFASHTDGEARLYLTTSSGAIITEARFSDNAPGLAMMVAAAATFA